MNEHNYALEIRARLKDGKWIIPKYKLFMLIQLGYLYINWVYWELSANVIVAAKFGNGVFNRGFIRGGIIDRRLNNNHVVIDYLYSPYNY